MRQVKKVSLAICIASVLGATGHTAQASGFAVPEISILGLGTSNAVVANTKDLGAIPYNPAAAAFHPGATLTGGLMLVAPSLEVTTASGNHESQGEDFIPIPMLQGTYAISDVITLGLGINAPLGLETEWETTTFPGFVGAAAAGHPTSSKIELVDISPTLAFRIGPHTAIAAGLSAHAERPRFTSWELWGDSCCYNGDLPALLAETEKCRCVHPDKSIRLTVHDFATRSRLSLALNRPQLAA